MVNSVRCWNDLQRPGVSHCLLQHRRCCCLWTTSMTRRLLRTTSYGCYILIFRWESIITFEQFDRQLGINGINILSLLVLRASPKDLLRDEIRPCGTTRLITRRPWRNRLSLMHVRELKLETRPQSTVNALAKSIRFQRERERTPSWRPQSSPKLRHAILLSWRIGSLSGCIIYRAICWRQEIVMTHSVPERVYLDCKHRSTATARTKLVPMYPVQATVLKPLSPGLELRLRFDDLLCFSSMCLVPGNRQ